MELPEIGLQCSQSDCKQLDFLPLQCKSCGKQFCTEHFNAHSKTCQQNLTLSEDEIQDRKITQTFKCSKEHCNETSIVPLICEKCRKHFCVKHRHIVSCSEKTAQEIQAEKELFNAPIRQFNAAKDKVDKQIEDSLNQAKKKGQHKEQMAIKVQLMKIKNKAVGLKSVPTSDRVYFNVHFSSRKNSDAETRQQQQSNGLDLTKFDRTLPVFVSRNWSLGRTIDAIAQECSLTNNNNKSAERKLRLFKKDGGDIVSKNMADVLSKLLDDKSMIDGENLIIEYVDDSCDRL